LLSSCASELIHRGCSLSLSLSLSHTHTHTDTHTLYSELSDARSCDSWAQQCCLLLVIACTTYSVVYRPYCKLKRSNLHLRTALKFIAEDSNDGTWQVYLRGPWIWFRNLAYMRWWFESYRLTRSSEVASLIFCVVNCSCVSVVTRLRAGDRGKRFLSNASELIGCVSVYGRVKLQELEADCSPLSSAEVKSLSIPPFLHVSLLRSLINAWKVSYYNLCPLFVCLACFLSVCCACSVECDIMYCTFCKR
jgi:hypothetical protein